MLFRVRKQRGSHDSDSAIRLRSIALLVIPNVPLGADEPKGPGGRPGIAVKADVVGKKAHVTIALDYLRDAKDKPKFEGVRFYNYEVILGAQAPRLIGWKEVGKPRKIHGLRPYRPSQSRTRSRMPPLIHRLPGRFSANVIASIQFNCDDAAPAGPYFDALPNNPFAFRLLQYWICEFEKMLGQFFFEPKVLSDEFLIVHVRQKGGSTGDSYIDSILTREL